jgi:Zn-dependent M16 (insulinase) family peptidase
MPAAREQRSSHFKTIQQFQLEYAPVTVTQYESSRTGMRCVVVDQKGPKVNGYFALATEIHDDSGAPHTLEHLCFMGSKSYRYKGLLDKLATRAYSTTNAWTATDQTAYTLETAGWDGFAQILPVYLEHLIVPTLTDEGCYTEVHHIDGEGKDAGVVYSEMQGVQNNQGELMELRAKRLMYPEGNGFRYETGGMMEQLRVLTADRIREFHKAMYQPKNMCLVLTGEVDHDDLLHILDDFEETVIDEVPKLEDPFTRPWVDSKPTPPLKETTVEKVNFPEEDESMGEIMVGFLGPDCNDHIGFAALAVLLNYLCGSSISVMENTLVEREQLCSAIYYSTDFRPSVTIWFSLAAVETDQLETVEKRLFELLKETAAKEFDMAYMQDTINRWRRQILLKCENAGDFFSEPIIEDHLFGRRDGKDLKELATIKELDVLQSWTDRQWRDFFSKWLADAHHISILGVPSKELSDKVTNDEKARVKAQREKFGEKGLKELEEKLTKAKAENDKPIPDSLLEQFPVPSTDSVHFISTVTARSGAARKMGKLDNSIQSLIDKDDTDSPLFIHFEHIPSNFVRIKLEMCTSSIPVELRPLLSLYMMNFFTSPVNKDGKRLEFEDVVLELERDTVDYSIRSNYVNPELMNISFCTEPKNYEKIISWIRTLFFDAIHDPVRLHASLTKLLADIPDEKRSGDSMLSSAYFMTAYTRSSSARARTTLAKALYLRRVRKLLKDSPDEVISKLTTVCTALHRPENFRVKVAGNIETLSNPVSAWNTLTASHDTNKPLEPLDSRREYLNDVGKNCGSAAFVVPISAIDSSFAMLVSDGPENLQHPDLPALRVAQSYMNAVEGPMWVAVRGTGLAYGVYFNRSEDTGKFTFRISRSPDAYKAYKAGKEQVEGYSSGKIPLDKFALEGAISEIVLDMANEQPTMSAAAELSFSNQVIRGIEKDYSHKMLARVRDVTPEQIRDAMTKYMLPVFDPKKANLMVTCAPIMSEGVVGDFKKAGFNAEIKALDEFQDDYGMKAPEGEDEESEEEDDESGSGEDESGSEDDK